MSPARARALSIALTAVLCALSGTPAATAGAQGSRWAGAVASGREAIGDMLESSGTPGLGVAVAAGGEAVWSEGFGQADLEHRVPVTRRTRFGIGSISKSLTTALVGRLVDDGLLDMDAPVERYLPGFPHAGRGITVRLIAAHLSGMDDRTERRLHHTARHFVTTQEALEEIWHDPVTDEPGTLARYGTGTYTIIAAVVEQVTGQAFLSAMQAHVTGPLGLASTVPNQRRAIVADRTAFYERTADGETRHAPYADPSFKWAGAGYLSTAEDLARFGQAMSGPGFLSRRTWEEIVGAARTRDGTPVPFALGWDAPRAHPEGGRVIGKSGGGPGIRAYLALYPDCDLAIAVLTNLSRAPVRGAFWEALAGPFLAEARCHGGAPPSSGGQPAR